MRHDSGYRTSQISYEYRPVQPEEDGFLLYFEGKKALADWDSEKLSFPRFRDYPEVEESFLSS